MKLIVRLDLIWTDACQIEICVLVCRVYVLLGFKIYAQTEDQYSQPVLTEKQVCSTQLQLK